MTAPDLGGAYPDRDIICQPFSKKQYYQRVVTSQKRPPWGGRALSFLRNDGDLLKGVLYQTA